MGFRSRVVPAFDHTSAYFVSRISGSLNHEVYVCVDIETCLGVFHQTLAVCSLPKAAELVTLELHPDYFSIGSLHGFPQAGLGWYGKGQQRYYKQE